MNLEISKHGDALEREFSELIINNLPAYNEIWKIYIGHDGMGKMLDVKGLNEKQQNTRIVFSQYHYTCLECIAGMSIIVENSKKYSYTQFTDILRQNNDFIAFHALLGKIRDCIKVLGELFSISDLYLKFEDFWKERNIVIHQKKLPYILYDGLYLVLKNANLINDEPNNNELSWYEFKEDDFTFICDYLVKTFDGVVVELNSSLYNLLNKIKELKFKTKFELLNNKTNEHFFDINNLTEQFLNTNFSASSINNKYIRIKNLSSVDLSEYYKLVGKSD